MSLACRKRPGATIAAFVLCGLLLGGCRDYENTTADRAQLRKVCDPVRDVPAAFEAHKKAHGSFPVTVADLDMKLPGSSAAVAALKAAEGFVYSSSGDSFSIYKKLNWDGGVSYSSTNPRWRYTLNEDKEVIIY